MFKVWVTSDHSAHNVIYGFRTIYSLAGTKSTRLCELGKLVPTTYSYLNGEVEPHVKFFQTDTPDTIDRNDVEEEDILMAKKYITRRRAIRRWNRS